MRWMALAVVMVAACSGPPKTQQQACADVVTAVLQREVSCGLVTDEIIATQQNAMIGSCCEAAGGCTDALADPPGSPAWSACLKDIGGLSCDATTPDAMPDLPTSCKGFVPLGGGALDLPQDSGGSALDSGAPVDSGA